MISVQKLTKTYGIETLFEDVTFTVGERERLGLVGRNGHGKTTLFRIITGEEQPDSGRLEIPRGYRIGYLRQHICFCGKSVVEDVCSALPPGNASERWRAEKVLSGLGFSSEDMKRPPSEFSGGYQMRISLARVLVSGADMLLLDEPTNYLDILSIRWLEGFLRRWPGELIVISHDRNFMDNVVTHVLGLHRQHARKIEGDTQKYYGQINREEEIYEKRRLNEDKKRKQITQYIDSFRAKARHAKSVQSSIKALKKMGRLEKLHHISSLNFSFTHMPFAARQIMQVKGLRFSYDGKMPYVVDGVDFVVDRNDKICIIGANGRGKTTLLKLLAGELKPLSGDIRLHPGAQKAYFEQANTAKLDDSRTIEEELGMSNPSGDVTRVRNVCGAMMFSGDDALKRISVLSGGEKCRVLLGKQLLLPANLLLLDEPTHHLDMQSCDAIIEAVEDFEGASIVVTHDEYFLHRAANKLIVFQEGRVMVFPGTYQEFLEQVGWGEEDITAGGTGKSDEKLGRRELSRKERAEFIAARSRALKPYIKKISGLEKAIESSEERLDNETAAMVEASSSGDAQAIGRISRALHVLQAELDSLYGDLERVTEKYEQEKKKFGENSI